MECPNDENRLRPICLGVEEVLACQTIEAGEGRKELKKKKQRISEDWKVM